jgi:predicted TIM-barrel fold metal-dependent hydrolase
MPATRPITPTDSKPPIINCHTHIFTGDHVPPWLAKTFVPWPFYYLMPLHLYVSLFRWWYKYPATIPYTAWYKKLRERITSFQTAFNKLGFVRTIIEYYIALHAFFYLYQFITPVFHPDKTKLLSWIEQLRVWLNNHHLFFFPASLLLKLLVIVFTLVLLPSGRNLILFVMKKLWSALGKLPGKQTTEMFKRYLNIGRYAFHRQQKTILSQLKGQYPFHTKLIVLPMDMEYMQAGKPTHRYRDQMRKLSYLKNRASNKEILHPFVAIDPRRMVPKQEEKRIKKGDKIFFDYEADNGKVKLNDCFIRYFIEEKKFSGFKIYPALGYYPFDARLLPLWKYAADNGIPLMTHCVSGPMFYRGRKKPEWNHHPFFEQAMGCEDKTTDTDEDDDNNLQTKYEPLALHQLNNADFTVNFTHPLNYLCLLDKEMLTKVVAKAYQQTGDERLKEVFGFDGTSIAYDLSHLKICMGHYGGGDQWIRYFEKDRYGYSNQLTKNKRGIEFFKKANGEPSKGKIEQLWNYTDWYSIISSMMLQYKNVYADISYILHCDKEILPLLKQTLQNDGLREKVLYGTDFYVVRNHKSDKNMLADMMGGLDENDFDQIARINPVQYLANSI